MTKTEAEMSTGMGSKESGDPVGKSGREGGEKEGLAPSPMSGVQQARGEDSPRGGLGGGEGSWTNPPGIPWHVLDSHQ